MSAELNGALVTESPELEAESAPIAVPATALGPVSPDLELMNRAQQGDLEAYASLFEGHTESIRKVAYVMLHDASAADDVVQDTFAKGLVALKDFRGTGRPRGWLMTIAINICRHRLRSAKCEPGYAGQDALNRGQRIHVPRTRGVVSRVILSEMARKLSLAMGFLTEAQREAVALRYQEGLSFQEIGEILNLRSGAVRALVHRAKATLRKELGEEVLEDSRRSRAADPDEEAEA
jgi:RNA polymerase sigma-70 factor (ECF subfamily)